jgi:protein phosphatase
MPVRPADSFVLCSDGLYDLVSGEEIREVVLAAEPEEACQKLVAMARGRGGYDNITVAVVGTAGRVSLKATRSIEVHG